jgi:hypothetical protein
MPNGDGSPSDEQFHLSESCKEIIDLYHNSDLSKEDQEDNFWNKLKEFTRHANEAKNKTRYKIAELVEKLNNYKAIIESLKSEVEVAKDGALPYLHLKETILRDYSQSISIVEQLQEKSLKVENKKFQGIDITWAHPFLNGYYNIISNAGGVTHFITAMQRDLQLRKDKLIQGGFILQKFQLKAIITEIKNLSNLQNPCPPDISENVSGLENKIKTFLEIYDQNTNLDRKVEMLNDQHNDLQLEIRRLYQETINRCISGANE